VAQATHRAKVRLIPQDKDRQILRGIIPQVVAKAIHRGIIPQVVAQATHRAKDKLLLNKESEVRLNKYVAIRQTKKRLR
jgi:hypothetical protein